MQAHQKANTNYLGEGIRILELAKNIWTKCPRESLTAENSTFELHVEGRNSLSYL